MLHHERLRNLPRVLVAIAAIEGAAWGAVPARSAGESAGFAPVTVSWTDGTKLGRFEPSATLAGTVTNHSGSSRDVAVDVVALGLDGRMVVRPMTTVRVPARGSSTVSLTLSDVPIRSVGSETTFWLRARAGVTIDGPHQSAEWDSTYSTVTLHGDLGSDLDRAQPPRSASRSAWLAATHPAFHRLSAPVGAVWTGSTFVDVTKLSANGRDGVSHALRGQWATDYHELASTFSSGYRAPARAPWYRICLRWRALFIDNQTSNGLSDDVLTGTDGPAIYATSTIMTDELAPRIVWNGVLDDHGCTPTLSLNRSDKFTVLATTDLVKPDSGGTSALITYSESSPTPLVVVEALDLATTSGGSHATPELVTLTPAVEDMATRAAAVAGPILANDDMLPPGFVARIHANTGCPDAWATDANGVQTEACAGAGRVRLGYVLDTSTNLLNPDEHNSQYKYIVAHEIGHLIGEAAFGVTYWVPGQDGVQDEACRCDHVKSGNVTHCLTSRQAQSFAMNEAFGHFIAARTFNDPRQGDCSFAYYKTTVDGLPPPQNVSCTGTPRWLETHCSTEQDYGGTELDWLTFFYDVTRGADALTMPFLAESFMRACTGAPTTRCALQDVYFNRLPEVNRGAAQPASSLADAYCAALTAHGELPCSVNPKFAKFMADAASHGIVH